VLDARIVCKNWKFGELAEKMFYFEQEKIRYGAFNPKRVQAAEDFS